MKRWEGFYLTYPRFSISVMCFSFKESTLPFMIVPQMTHVSEPFIFFPCLLLAYFGGDFRFFHQNEAQIPSSNPMPFVRCQKGTQDSFMGRNTNVSDNTHLCDMACTVGLNSQMMMVWCWFWHISDCWHNTIWDLWSKLYLYLNITTMSSQKKLAKDKTWLIDITWQISLGVGFRMYNNC